MAFIFCPECGNQVSEKAEICNKCGYPLHKIIENKIQSTPPIVTPQPKAEPKIELSKNTDLLIIIFFFCYLLLNSNSVYRIYEFIFLKNKPLGEEYDKGYENFELGHRIFLNCIPILLCIAIKNKKAKIICISITIIFAFRAYISILWR